MLVLALDTSTPAVTVALAELPTGAGAQASRPLADRTVVADNRHGELLAPLVEEVLRSAAVTPTDLTAIGVGLGPGPFTGLRVGIVTAASMADALGIPAYGVCSLDVVAAAHRGSGHDVAVVTDARRRQVYWAVYDGAGARVTGPDISAPAALADRLRGRVTHVAGAGLQRYAADFAAGFTVVTDHGHPDAAAIPRMVAPRVRRGEPSEELTPMYLRRPDAVPPGRPKQVTPA